MRQEQKDEIEAIATRQDELRQAFERLDLATDTLKSAIKLADVEPDFLPKARARVEDSEEKLAALLKKH